jgi:hypothetical protein
MVPAFTIAQEKHKVDLLAFLFNSNIKKFIPLLLKMKLYIYLKFKTVNLIHPNWKMDQPVLELCISP